MTATDDIRKISRLERALKIIQTWASFEKDSGDSYEGMRDVLVQIAGKAEKALKGGE